PWLPFGLVAPAARAWGLARRLPAPAADLLAGLRRPGAARGVAPRRGGAPPAPVPPPRRRLRREAVPPVLRAPRERVRGRRRRREPRRRPPGRGREPARGGR